MKMNKSENLITLLLLTLAISLLSLSLIEYGSK